MWHDFSNILNTQIGSILGLAHFLLYNNDLPDDVICGIAICAFDIILYSNCDQAFDLSQQLELDSELETNLRDTVDWGRKLISMLERLNWFRLIGLITLVLLMWINRHILTVGSF